MSCHRYIARQHMTLLEIAVMLVVLAVLAAAIVPATLKIIAAQRMTETKEEMKELYDAIVGDPDRNNYGFVGDLGELPASLENLVEAGSYPTYTTDGTYGVGMGWNGPYLLKSADDVMTDAFGQLYEFDPSARAQISSAGPDRTHGTSDDLLYPPSEISPYGTIRIELANTENYAVSLYYSDAGHEKVLTATTAPYLFESIHFGPHAVEVLLKQESGNLPVAHSLALLSAKTAFVKVEF